MAASNEDNACKSYVNELRVLVEKCKFTWKLDGFDEVPYLTDYPIFSSSFILGSKSESVWQMLVAKEKRCKNKRSGKMESKLCDVKIKIEPESPESEADTFSSEVEADTPSTGIETDQDSKDMEIDTNIEAEIKSEQETEEQETMSEEPALGFKLIKTEEGSTWDVIKYRVEITIGDFKKSTRERMETGSPYCSTADFLYMYESDLEGIDLDSVKTLHMEAFIEYTYIDLYPLEPAEDDGEQFTEDLCRLFKSQKFSDVILKAGNSQILAHKGILCARAYGFDCHLQEDSAFVKQRVVLDLEECVARAMLAFIYCNGLPVEFPLEKCKALCAAASKYQVNGLKPLVNKFFKKNLDPEVCKQCLKIGDSDSIDLEAIDLSEEQFLNVLQKKACSHKSGESK